MARGYDIFAPPDWAWAEDGEVFTNRFDDPGAYRGIPQDKRFRIIYCATRDAGAYGETIKYFRRNPNAPAGLQGGCVPQEWLSYRRIGSTQLNENLLFADFTDARTFTILGEELSSWLPQFGLKEFDLSAMTSQHRRLTQEAARYVYELADSGHTAFAGIRYLSRLNPRWELWAIFDKRMLHVEQVIETIPKDSPGLLEAANALDLDIGCEDAAWLQE